MGKTALAAADEVCTCVRCKMKGIKSLILHAFFDPTGRLVSMAGRGLLLAADSHLGLCCRAVDDLPFHRDSFVECLFKLESTAP